MKIVVLDTSWNVVGELEKDGDDFLLTNGSVIRRWGTTQGLGEIAVKGPLPETILDPLPLTKFNKDRVVMIIDCDETKWKK